MQVVSYDEEKMATDQLEQNNESIVNFSLQGTLPAGYTLALNTALGTLAYLSYNEDGPIQLMQQQFSRSELSVLLPLLKSFPYYCPYEVLYASFYYSQVNDQVVARCRQHLQQAFETGVWDQEIKPLRNVLSRTRLKLKNFGLNITSILETGYLLRVVFIPEIVAEP